jgi:hypothetical protein
VTALGAAAGAALRSDKESISPFADMRITPSIARAAIAPGQAGRPRPDFCRIILQAKTRPGRYVSIGKNQQTKSKTYAVNPITFE